MEEQGSTTADKSFRIKIILLAIIFMVPIAYAVYLKMTGWRIRGKNGAAEILDLKPTTLDSRLKRLGIKRSH